MSEEKKNEVLDQAEATDEQELSDVAGGKKCYCVVGGGGEASWGEKTCVCVVGGGGEVNDEGRPLTVKRARCVCTPAGYGGTL